MKTLFVIALSLVSVSAFARPNTQNLTCDAAAALVRNSGAIVLSTGPGLYDRFVTGDRFCDSHERAVPAWVPTKDDKTCYIGSVCRDRDNAGGVVFPGKILTCKEGKTTFFQESNYNNDSSESVLYVCRSGKWLRADGGSTGGSEAKPIVCKEGSRVIWQVPNYTNDSSDSVVHICRSGKWRPEY